MHTALRLRTAARALPRVNRYAGATRQQPSLQQEGVEPPEIAATNENISHSWEEKSKSKDVGHATIGAGHGRHQARTLASFSMEGKVCVVTGAARGLGNLFARTFVESGCTNIVLMDLKQEEAQQAADDLVKWFVDHGDIEPGAVTAIGMGCDVSKEESVKEGFEAVVKRFGKVDAMVASAGIVENYSAFDYPTARIRLLYDINVHGAFFCAREAARHMIDKGTKGSIVLVSSMSANIVNVPQPQTPYNSSKAAVKHMAASLAVEWAKSGIRVNALSPGYMLTSLTRAILDKNEELKNTWVNLTPMGRMGEPEDLKGAIVYLASDASAFTNGVELRPMGRGLAPGVLECAYCSRDRVDKGGQYLGLNADVIADVRIRCSSQAPGQNNSTTGDAVAKRAAQNGVDGTQAASIPSTLSTPRPSVVGPVSPQTGLPDALSHIPIEYIIDRLRGMAPYYWHRPETTNCTIIVPTESLRMFSRVPNGHTAVSGTSVNGPPSIKDTRRSSAPNAGARQPIRVRTISPPNRPSSATCSPIRPSHLDPAQSGSRPLFTFSSLRLPRMTGPAHNPTVLLPVPDHASFALLVHYLYFGDTRTIEQALRTGAVTWEGGSSVDGGGYGSQEGAARQRTATTDAVEEEDEEGECQASMSAAADREAEGRDDLRTEGKVQTGQGLVDADELAAMLERV
ncbi:Enoyl-(Acyl carrier protein) reductase [Ceratobasidium sp. AG-Ba]|nr:Enoyl-(Acyl carrier protein) reductase [Ceratobasidium sp. AG-Ba]